MAKPAADDQTEAVSDDKNGGENQIGILDQRKRFSADGDEAVGGADCLHVGCKTAGDQDQEADAAHL